MKSDSAGDCIHVCPPIKYPAGPSWAGQGWYHCMSVMLVLDRPGFSHWNTGGGSGQWHIYTHSLAGSNRRRRRRRRWRIVTPQHNLIIQKSACWIRYTEFVMFWCSKWQDHSDQHHSDKTTVTRPQWPDHSDQTTVTRPQWQDYSDKTTVTSTTVTRAQWPPAPTPAAFCHTWSRSSINHWNGARQELRDRRQQLFISDKDWLIV